MDNTLLVIAYGITIIASAVAGGYLPHVIRMNHVRMQVVLSFVGGLMLGVAILHLIPHGFVEIHKSQIQASQIEASQVEISQNATDTSFESIEFGAHERKRGLDSVLQTMQAVLVGLLFTFFMMRAFHFHQHGDEEDHDHGHHDHGDHHHDSGHGHGDQPRTKLGWLGMIFGLATHTFVDGIALGAAVLAGHGNVFAGFGVYLAILLHKPLDALSLATLMGQADRSQFAINVANACFGLTCLVGALAALYLPLLAGGGVWLGLFMAGSAGVFLCISLSDLLPEVQFHQHDRLQLSAALLVGIGVSLGIELLHPHG